MKRLCDFIAALVALLLLFPVFIIVAICILVNDFGPVFYKQERVGRNGKPFHIYKFRSMRIDADKIGPYFTSENDPRITKIGAFLRRTSIDELPQLLNVLLGHMSVVGPRPNVFAQQELYSESDWELRNKVRPGITGLAQATKRSSATQEERNSLDLQYVLENSLFSDFKIILLTIKQIVSKGGN